MTKITKHGAKRTKDRLGLSKNVATKNADKAFELGLKHGECKGDLKRYIDKLYFRHGSGCDYRIYNRHVYCFKGPSHNLVTVMDVPQKLCALADKLQDKKSEDKTCSKKDS